MRANNEELARIAYTAYGYSTNFKNFRGEEMPKYDALPEKIREAWRHVASTIREIGERQIIEKIKDVIESCEEDIAK